MSPPDRGKVALSLGDDQPSLVLWFPPGALAALAEKAGIEIPLTNALGRCLDALTPERLYLYVWAGRLWEERALEPEAVRERVQWAPRGVFKLAEDVTSALILSILERDPRAEKRTEADADPPEPTAMNGRGRARSSSPSASSTSD